MDKVSNDCLCWFISIWRSAIDCSSTDNEFTTDSGSGVGIDKAEIYVTASPCYNCFKLIANAGIQAIYYDEFYRDEHILAHADEAGIQLVSLD